MASDFRLSAPAADTSEEQVGRSGQPFPETRTAGPERVGQPVHLRDLVADPENRRKHTERNLAMIVDALHQVGAARSIVIDENNVVLAGNATIDAAAEAGIERVRIIEATGHEIIAVRRRGLTEEQKRHLALADNRAAELATWDLDQLRADVDAGLDLGAFFEPTELADLLGADAPVPKFQPEAAPEHPLDRLADNVKCPNCGHRFHQEAR